MKGTQAMMGDRVGVVTLRQPWAFTVTHLGSRVLNRSSKPPAVIAGGVLLAIRTGTTFDDNGFDALLERSYEHARQFLLARDSGVAAFGAIVAVAYVRSYVEDPSHLAESQQR